VSTKEVHEELVQRLNEKITSARDALTRLDVRHMDGAKVAVVSLGATARPALGAVEAARADGHPVRRYRNCWPTWTWCWYQN
jgi:hypothetical protein